MRWLGMAEAALTPRTHLLLYYSLRNIPVFLSMRVLTEVSQLPLPSTATTTALLFHQCVAKPGGSWTDRKVAFKRDWLVSGDTKSLDHKQCLMFDLHLSVKWKCRDTWKNILFDSWVGWNISHSVVISDLIPSSYTFKRKRQKKKKPWLIFGVKSSTLPLTHGYERQGSVPCLTCL